MNQLEQRKRALVAESEIYRQMLNIEVQNLRLCSVGLSQNINQYRGLFTLIPMASSLLAMLSGGFRKRRKKGWRHLLATGLLAWRFYRKFGPFLQSSVAHFLAKRPTASSRADEPTPAGDI